jgi:hypothetical protein
MTIKGAFIELLSYREVYENDDIWIRMKKVALQSFEFSIDRADLHLIHVPRLIRAILD